MTQTYPFSEFGYYTKYSNLSGSAERTSDISADVESGKILK